MRFAKYSTNLSELIVVDHSAGSEVLIDKYGKLCAISTPYSPLSATNLEGNDILSQILSKDSISYFGSDPGSDPNFTDGAIMEFEIPEETDTLNICLRAKNSFWLDYLFTRFHGLFGSKYDKYVESQGWFCAEMTVNVKNGPRHHNQPSFHTASPHCRP